MSFRVLWSVSVTYGHVPKSNSYTLYHLILIRCLFYHHQYLTLNLSLSLLSRLTLSPAFSTWAVITVEGLPLPESNAEFSHGPSSDCTSPLD